MKTHYARDRFPVKTKCGMDLSLGKIRWNQLSDDILDVNCERCRKSYFKGVDLKSMSENNLWDELKL